MRRQRFVEPKRYEETCKRQAVEHWLRSGKNGTQIAQELGISYPSPSRSGSVATEGMPRRSVPIWKPRIARCVPSWHGCVSRVTF
jgi:transposase-like protein